MSQERRKDRRVPVDLWIEAEEGEAGEAVYFQHAANLSVGGAFFAKTVPQPVGTRVRLRFNLPGPQGEREIRCQGEIVNSSERSLGMGVRFLDLAEADRKAIEELIARLAKE